METGDIVSELSTSNIVEDDLNGIFNSLEPLEDPKDDMFFFGGKDLLQSMSQAILFPSHGSFTRYPSFPTTNIFI
jgi:hypothetical protein